MGMGKVRAVVVRGPQRAHVRFAPCLPLCPLCADLLCSAPSVRFALVCLACAHLSDISHNVRFDTQGGAGHPLNG